MACSIAAGKPIVIGECPVNGTGRQTLTANYEAAFNHGWAGAMGWSSDGVDRTGGFEELAPATRAIYAEHPEVVFPKTSAVKTGDGGR